MIHNPRKLAREASKQSMKDLLSGANFISRSKSSPKLGQDAASSEEPMLNADLVDGKNDTTKELGVLYNPDLVEIDERDFNRVLSDIKNNTMWKTVFHSDERTVMVSKSPFYNGRKGLKKMCETGVIPYSVDEVFHAYVDADYIQNIESEIHAITNLDYVEKNGKALSVLRFQYKLPFPLTNRDFCLIHSARRIDDGYIMIRKSIRHNACPISKNYIRAVASGGIVFEKLGENTTRYTQTYFADYGGWILPVIFNKIVEKRDNKWHDAMVSACKIRKEKNSGEKNSPELSYRIMDTLKYHDRN
ncbi:hypothetical protein AKO1_008579 [Acrasis kona]|uniref:START domain-containing protein n=1 Tax=Acrasis kona TaxID=1008807 RepID=A0AAW2YMJ8_9EUKA